jgi:hypothetical protein
MGRQSRPRGTPGWWSVPRRTFLRSSAALIGLPILDIMGPRIRRAQAAGAPPPRRFVTFGIPAGVNTTAWKPTGTGSTYTLSPTLMPLAPLQQDVSVLMGVNNNPANGARGHTCGIGAFLTCFAIPMTDPGVTESISADQVAANYLGQFTKLPSIELTTRILHETPNAESGFSPAYKNVVAWTNPTTSLPFEEVPLNAFNRLFSSSVTTGSSATTAAAAAKQVTYRKSVLDSVSADIATIRAKGSAADQAKMDQYLTSLRQLETEITTNPPPTSSACMPGTPPPAGTPSDMNIQAHVKQMLDIMVMAMQCDATRVLTFYYENTVTSIVHSFLNVNVDYHGSVTHHNNDPQKLAWYATVNNWQVSQLAYLLTQMKAVQEPDGTLLDNSVVFFSSEITDGNLHNHSNLPIVLAGRGGGMLNPGRAIQFQNANVSQLFIAMLATVGVTVKSFGDGTTPLAGL